MSIKSILCVDDSPSDLKLLESTLAEAGYTVAVARNGKEAVQAAWQTRPDLILMDVNMPEMDGFQATRTLSGSDQDDPRRARHRQGPEGRQGLGTNAGRKGLHHQTLRP